MIKKLFSALALLCIVNNAFAQSIPNGGFESWTTTIYKNPQNYFSSNLQGNNGYTNPVNVVRTTDSYSDSFAVKLSTVLVGNDTAAAYMANGDPSHPVGQGIPISETPTGMRVYYKCNVMPNDTAIVFIMFKSGGVIIDQYVQKITGTQSTYSLLAVSFNLMTAPDSLIFGALSSNILGNSRGIPGSTLQIDSVSFTGVSAQLAQLNGDFENWQTITNHSLKDWSVQQSGNNPGTLQTTDAYSGTYALELQTKGTNQAGDTAYSTTATTGYSTYNGTNGGYPYTQTNDSLIFYYKYVPTDVNDSAEVTLSFKKAGAYIANYGQRFPATATYKRAVIPVNLMQTPDSVIVFINSSKDWSVPPSYLGADLKIDNMYFKSQPITPAAALSFDGVDDNVTIPSLTLNGNSGTWEAWVQKADWTDEHDDRLFGNGINFTTSNSFYVSLHPAVGFHFRYGGSADQNNMYVSSLATNNLNAGSWHHLAATWNFDGTNTTIKIYLDGNILSSNSNAISIPVNTPAFYLGGGGDVANPYFGQGAMDEVRLWNRALCQSEIQNNMNGEIVTTANGLIANYHFNQGTNNDDNTYITTLTDATGANNGTLTNFALTGTVSNFVAPGGVTTGSIVATFSNTLSAVATQTNLACNGDGSGIASVAVTGIESPFTYAWSSGGSTTNTATGLAAGDYTCTIGNACGAIAKTFTLTEPSLLTVTATATPVLCNGGVTTVTVTESGGTAPYSGGGIFTNLTANDYTYTVIDNNGCTSTATITVTQPNPITTVLSPTLCAGSGIQVGTHFYTTAGTYTDILTAANGCDSTVTTNLTVTHVTAAFSHAAPTCSCNTVFFQDSSYVNTADPVVAWAWTVTGGYPTQTFTVQSFGTPLAFGTNTVCLKVTTQGGCTDSICKVINQNIQGIDQYSYVPTINIYPNPAQNNFTVETNSTEKQTLHVFDVNGKLVLSQIINSTTTINAEILAPGAYNISLISNYGVANKRLVIVK